MERAGSTVGVGPTNRTGPAYKVPAPEPPLAAARYEPWPPNKASATYRYPERFLRPFRGKTVGEFFDAFEERLRAAGYATKLSMFSLSDGIVIVTAFELVSAGYPATSGRFAVGTSGFPGLLDGMGQWINPSTGHARSFAFILGPSGKQTNVRPEFSKQRDFYKTGKSVLPDELRAGKILAHDRLCALVYEYSLPKREDPVFIDDSKTDAIEHLRRSNIPTGEGL
jgi:hypothetical protein